VAAVRFQGSRAELVTLLRSVTAAVSGSGPDRDAVAAAVLTRGAVALLSQIQTAFVVKARGGTGSDGIKWKPLAPSTIARRRTSRSELRRLGIGGGRGLGTLTDAEKTRWRRIYRASVANLRARGVDEDLAQNRAQAAAWGVLRREGANTKHKVLESRSVEILRDTSALFRSLTPGYETAPASEPGQIRQVEPGRITVGTSEKAWHHAGGKNLPARPFWPPDGNLPDAWWEAVQGAILRGLIAAIQLTARG
jgi:hypothetical protein